MECKQWTWNMNGGGVSMWNALCHFVHDKSMNDSLGMRTNIFSLYTNGFGGVYHGLTENHHTYYICDRIDVRIHTTYEWICSIILWHHVPIIYPRAHNTHYTIYYVIVFLFLSICHDALLFFFYSFNDFPFATESACPCRCSTLNTHFKLTHIRLYANVYLSYRWLFGCTRLSQSRACAM